MVSPSPVGPEPRTPLKKYLFAGSGLVLIAAVVLAVALIRGRSSTPPAPGKPVAKTRTSKKLKPELTASPPIKFERLPAKAESRALSDAALADLVSNFVFAAVRGDDTTQGALLKRFQRTPAKAKGLLAAELDRAKDPKVAEKIRGAIAQLP